MRIVSSLRQKCLKSHVMGGRTPILIKMCVTYKIYNLNLLVWTKYIAL